MVGSKTDSPAPPTQFVVVVVVVVVDVVVVVVVVVDVEVEVVSPPPLFAPLPDLEAAIGGDSAKRFSSELAMENDNGGDISRDLRLAESSRRFCAEVAMWLTKAKMIVKVWEIFMVGRLDLN